MAQTPPPPERSSNYDPYDPGRRPRRRIAEPRLVDYSKPLPPPDPGPAAPRPHQPQKRLKPEDIVPPSDNPMRGWRGLGAALLSRHLWPRDARTNAVVVYYTGRRRGRLLEDFMGFWPWLLLLVFDAFMMIHVATTFAEVWAYGVANFIFLFPFGATCGAILTTFHIRRIIDKLPLDELLLTRLKPVDIVQGLSLRPIAVQSFAVVCYAFGHVAIAAIAADRLGRGFDPGVIAYLTVFGLFRFYCMRHTIEMGGAIATRANMCLRPMMTAGMRTALDIGLTLFMLLIAAFLMASVATWLLACFLPLVILGPLIFCLCFGFLVAEALRSVATEAMDWTHLYPDEWWINNSAEAERREFAERTLMSPWKPIEGRRRLFVPRSLRRSIPPAPPHAG